MVAPVAGVYAIRQIGTDRYYIGSSFDIRKRVIDHKSALRRGTHHSIFLQRAWRAHGEHAFETLVLEVTPSTITDEELRAREQCHIDALNSCFNSSPTAGSILGFVHRPESRQMQSEKAKARMRQPSEAYRAYWASMEGQQRGEYPPEWGEAISRAKKGQHKGTSWSPARRAAQEAKRGKPHSERQKALWASRRGKHHTPEHKAKIGAGIRKWLDEHGELGAIKIRRKPPAQLPLFPSADEASA